MTAVVPRAGSVPLSSGSGDGLAGGGPVTTDSISSDVRTRAEELMKLVFPMDVPTLSSSFPPVDTCSCEECKKEREVAEERRTLGHYIRQMNLAAEERKSLQTKLMQRIAKTTIADMFVTPPVAKTDATGAGDGSGTNNDGVRSSAGTTVVKPKSKPVPQLNWSAVPTPIQAAYAIQTGQLTVLKAVMEKHPDITVNTNLELANVPFNKSLVSYLLQSHLIGGPALCMLHCCVRSNEPRSTEVGALTTDFPIPDVVIPERRVEVLTHLLNVGANLGSKDYRSVTVLQSAVMAGDVELCRALVQRSLELVKFKEDKRGSKLSAADKRQFRLQLEPLLADLQQLLPDGRSLSSGVCGLGDPAMLESLLRLQPIPFNALITHDDLRIFDIDAFVVTSGVEKAKRSAMIEVVRKYVDGKLRELEIASAPKIPEPVVVAEAIANNSNNEGSVVKKEETEVPVTESRVVKESPTAEGNVTDVPPVTTTSSSSLPIEPQVKQRKHTQKRKRQKDRRKKKKSGDGVGKESDSEGSDGEVEEQPTASVEAVEKPKEQVVSTKKPVEPVQVQAETKKPTQAEMKKPIQAETKKLTVVQVEKQQQQTVATTKKETIAPIVPTPKSASVPVPAPMPTTPEVVKLVPTQKQNQPAVKVVITPKQPVTQPKTVQPPPNPITPRPLATPRPTVQSQQQQQQSQTKVVAATTTTTSGTKVSITPANVKVTQATQPPTTSPVRPPPQSQQQGRPVVRPQSVSHPQSQSQSQSQPQSQSLPQAKPVVAFNTSQLRQGRPATQPQTSTTTTQTQPQPRPSTVNKPVATSTQTVTPPVSQQQPRPQVQKQLQPTQQRQQQPAVREPTRVAPTIPKTVSQPMSQSTKPAVVDDNELEGVDFSSVLNVIDDDGDGHTNVNATVGSSRLRFMDTDDVIVDSFVSPLSTRSNTVPQTTQPPPGLAPLPTNSTGTLSGSTGHDMMYGGLPSTTTTPSSFVSPIGGSLLSRSVSDGGGTLSWTPTGYQHPPSASLQFEFEPARTQQFSAPSSTSQWTSLLPQPQSSPSSYELFGRTVQQQSSSNTSSSLLPGFEFGTGLIGSDLLGAVDDDLSYSALKPDRGQSSIRQPTHTGIGGIGSIGSPFGGSGLFSPQPQSTLSQPQFQPSLLSSSLGTDSSLLFSTAQPFFPTGARPPPPPPPQTGFTPQQPPVPPQTPSSKGRW